MKKELKFKLQPAKSPVELENTGGTVINYELREMFASERDAYLDTIRDRMKYSKDGKPVGVGKFDGMHADLLTRTLFNTTSDQPVTKAEVQQWPASVTAELFRAAQELSGLNLTEDEKDEEKN